MCVLNMTPPSQFRIVIFLLVCHPKKTKTLPPNSIFPRVLLRVLWVVFFFWWSAKPTGKWLDLWYFMFLILWVFGMFPIISIWVSQCRCGSRRIPVNTPPPSWHTWDLRLGSSTSSQMLCSYDPDATSSAWRLGEIVLNAKPVHCHGIHYIVHFLQIFAIIQRTPNNSCFSSSGCKKPGHWNFKFQHMTWLPCTSDYLSKWLSLNTKLQLAILRLHACLFVFKEFPGVWSLPPKSSIRWFVNHHLLWPYACWKTHLHDM